MTRWSAILLAALLVLLTVQCGCCTGLVNELAERVFIHTDTIAYPPGVEVIVPESEKPLSFRFSPGKRRMLYHGEGAGWAVLNLETGEQTAIGQSLTGPVWVDDRYIYSRRQGGGEEDRYKGTGLIVDTQTWEVHSAEDWNQNEVARFEEAFSEFYDISLAQRLGVGDESKHYSPDGRYYYQDTVIDQYNIWITIYSQDDRMLNEYQGGYIYQAAWDHDSSGVYLLILKVQWRFPIALPSLLPGAILKLPVSPPPSGPAVSPWLRALVIVAVVLTLVVFTPLGWLIIKRRRRQWRSG